MGETPETRSRIMRTVKSRDTQPEMTYGGWFMEWATVTGSTVRTCPVNLI